MLSIQQPIRFVLTCLIAVAVSGGESFVCGSPVSGQNQGQSAKRAPGNQVPGQCRCGMKCGVCHCRVCCCQDSAPGKPVPLNPNNRGNNAGSSLKVLSQHSFAISAENAAAGWSSGKSRYALASLPLSHTLQAQCVRLQI